MVKHRQRFTLCMMVLMLTVLCSRSLAKEGLPFRVGEKLTFDIRYEFVKAGIATLEVQETNEYRSQSKCFRMVSERL